MLHSSDASIGVVRMFTWNTHWRQALYTHTNRMFSPFLSYLSLAILMQSNEANHIFSEIVANYILNAILFAAELCNNNFDYFHSSVYGRRLNTHTAHTICGTHRQHKPSKHILAASGHSTPMVLCTLLKRSLVHETREFHLN